MSEVRRSSFLKELRNNKEYMLFLHSALLNSKFMWFITALCILFTVAEYHTGGAFSGFIIALLIYILNYLAILFTASPAFAMRGHIKQKIVYAEYVDYTVENNSTVRKVISEKTDYNIGDEVLLYKFRPCFFISADRTGIAAACR